VGVAGRVGVAEGRKRSAGRIRMPSCSVGPRSSCAPTTSGITSPSWRTSCTNTCSAPLTRTHAHAVGGAAHQSAANLCGS
jgi:hypothetical protein